MYGIANKKKSKAEKYLNLLFKLDNVRLIKNIRGIKISFWSK